MRKDFHKTEKRSPKSDIEPCSARHDNDISHLRAYAEAAGCHAPNTALKQNALASLDAVLAEVGMTAEELEKMCGKKEI